MMSRYYRLTGDYEQAYTYADSSTVAHKKFEENFNLNKMHYAEMFEKQQQLDNEMLRSKSYLQNLIMVSIFAVVFLILVVLLYYFFRQKRSAYRALVVKTQQWAQVSTIEIDNKQEYDAIITTENGQIEKTLQTNNFPDEIDRQLFEQLTHWVIDKNIYRSPDITLDRIAQMMKINRSYLSQAINRCTGANFNTYINEFRVKEAVRILSEDKSQTISIEGIAFDAGFNDRTTFYRVFKKLTGLSPTQFRDNLRR
jgi:YesN/AraC family two-component response regulator